jgi:hypothetical protein
MKQIRLTLKIKSAASKERQDKQMLEEDAELNELEQKLHILKLKTREQSATTMHRKVALTLSSTASLTAYRRAAQRT